MGLNKWKKKYEDLREELNRKIRENAEKLSKNMIEELLRHEINFCDFSSINFEKRCYIMKELKLIHEKICSVKDEITSYRNDLWEKEKINGRMLLEEIKYIIDNLRELLYDSFSKKEMLELADL